MKYLLSLSILTIASIFTFRSIYSYPLVSLPAPTPTPTPHVSNTEKEITDDRFVWENVQNWRAQEKLPKYVETKALCLLAEKRAHELQDKYAHRKFTADEFKNTDNAQILSENISMSGGGYAPLSAWLASPPHAAALSRTDYKHSCLKCENEYCVQLFTY